MGCFLGLFLATMFLLPVLQFAQIIVEAIEPLFPVSTIVFEPIDSILQWRRLQPAGAPLRVTSTCDEPATLQDLEVPGDGGQRYVERLGEIVDGCLSRGEAREDGAPRRIGERGERDAELIGGCHRFVINLQVKYNIPNNLSSVPAFFWSVPQSGGGCYV